MKAMDITNEFVKLAAGSSQRRKSRTTAVSDFMQSAIEILQSVQKITSIRSDKRKQYLDPLHFLPSKASSFTDLDREELEESLLDSYKVCDERLSELHELHDTKHSQLSKLQAEIILYLNERIKRGVASTKEDQQKRTSRPFFLSKKLLPDGVDLDRVTLVVPQSKPSTKPIVSHQSTPSPSESVRVAEESRSNDDSIGLTDAESRQFMAENLQLHRHFHEEIDAARKVEQQVNAIQGMMNQFAQEIGQQTEKMENITKEATMARDNVGHGNQSLKKAADYGEGFGFMIFCFYFGASCLLLFFHYY
ncbi:hypothetical protein AC1031_006183 [Aphanomyces cochlioides]|nr:hypothetical protein AC1031_006183 [Aphanomyces cochlioides]